MRSLNMVTLFVSYYKALLARANHLELYFKIFWICTYIFYVWRKKKNYKPFNHVIFETATGCTKVFCVRIETLFDSACVSIIEWMCVCEGRGKGSNLVILALKSLEWLLGQSLNFPNDHWCRTVDILISISIYIYMCMFLRAFFLLMWNYEHPRGKSRVGVKVMYHLDKVRKMK